MKQGLKGTVKEKQVRKPLKQKLQIYNYDSKINNIWDMINDEIPEFAEIYKKYEDLLVNQSFSKAARVNNMRALLSLGRIAKSEDITWNTITKDQVNQIVSYIMRRWADPDGQETWHTADHKKFLMLFVRWIKTGRRKYSRKYPEPEEIRDIAIKKVPQKLTREDMITPDEEMELLTACGENIRDKAFISVHSEAGSRPGEILNLRIGHVEFLKNGGVIINVDGKTGDRPIHLIKSVPHLASWLEAHPYKDNPDSPLWISVANGMYGQNMTYSAARRMIQRRCEIAISKAKTEGKTSTIDAKRITMLVFRHTEITNASKWMPDAILKKRHGWSKTSKMASNYEHLSHEDVGNAVFERYGIDEKLAQMNLRIATGYRKMTESLTDAMNRYLKTTKSTQRVVNPLDIIYLSKKTHDNVKKLISEDRELKNF